MKLRMQESSERIKKRQEMKKKGPQTDQHKPKKLFGIGFGKIKTLMQSKEQKFNDEVFKHTNLIFNELSKFMQHLCNFNVPFDKAHNLLIYLCNLYQMDKSKMHILMTELMSNQKNTANMFPEKEQTYWSLMKRGERFTKFGFSNTATILGLTIKFVDSDEMLFNLLLLNKDLNEILKEEVLKQSLLRANQKAIERKRHSIWLQILNVNNKYVLEQYNYCRSQVPKLNPSTIESISVDVKRSFNKMESEINHE